MRVLTVLLALLWPVVAASHEVVPAIGDFSVAPDGTLTLSLAVNGEALVAGVDLDGLADTSESEADTEVDALRALPPADLETRLRDIAPGMATALNLTADGAPVDLAATGFTIDPVGDVALPRISQIVFTGLIPSETQDIALTWPRGYGDLVLRQQGVDTPYTGYLAGGQDSGPIPVAGSAPLTFWQALAQYVPVGFDHILPKGLDHILFVLGLFFLSTQLGPLVWQISAFTLAHTVTLALAVLGYVSIPASIVEPLIAASIVYVAVENIVSDKLQRWRPLVVFCFGLLHGLGFASVLRDFGLPSGQVVPALIGFNIGVEVGQLTVIAAAALLVWAVHRVERFELDIRTGQIVYGVMTLGFVALGLVLNTPALNDLLGTAPWVFFLPLAGLTLACAVAVTQIDDLSAYRTYVAVPASLGIALVGAYWFVERVFL